MKLNSKKLKVLETGLFIFGCVGVVATAVSSARDTLKAEKVLKGKVCIHMANEPVPYANNALVAIACTTKKEYVWEITKATWKCYIPTAIITTLTITSLVVSRRLTMRQVALLSSAVAGAGSLVTKYRNAIQEYGGQDVLHDIDRVVAKEEIVNARPPVISTSHLLSTNIDDLSEEGEFIFFDPFTKVKFRSTKLSVLGAKYYLNRNFSLGSEAPLSMFYSFLGLELPEEYSYAGWDVNEMAEQGYYWIDIDVVRSDAPDPETGELYYILEYDFLPGDCDENYYPFGNPLDTEGSYAV